MNIVSYDEFSQILIVEFHNNMRYEYFDIRRELLVEMQSADSPQDYFDANIWGIKFEHRGSWADISHLLRYLEVNMSFESPIHLNTLGIGGDTPLHVVCTWGDIQAIDLLLAGGANPNALGDMNSTPLHNAINRNHIRAVKRLLLAGAKSDCKNEFNMTPREEALKSTNSEMRTLFEIL
jgi:ankyrin repeat protein